MTFVSTRENHYGPADRELAEDLVQTALGKAYLAWRRVDDPDAYVRRVLVTTYVTWWRRRWHGERPAFCSANDAASASQAALDFVGFVRRDLFRFRRALALPWCGSVWPSSLWCWS